MAKLSGPKVELVSPSPDLQPSLYSTGHFAAQLTRHVHQTQNFQRMSGWFYILIAFILLVVGVAQSALFLDFLAVSFMAFGIFTRRQGRRSAQPKPPETQTK
jgi:hypothetical protein